jgi:hypothetical protein
MNQNRLEQECSTYRRYLIGQDPDPYVVRKYIEYHAQYATKVEPSDPFDRFLTEISARHPFWARLADTYAGRFYKHAAVRKKLVLMLALLECSPGSFEALDDVGRGGIPAALLRLAWQAAVYAGALMMAVLLFLPVQAWTAVFARSGKKLPALES